MRRKSIIAALALSGAALFAGVAPAQAGEAGTTATYVGGIQYWDSGYGGSTYTVTTSGTCDDSLDTDYSLSQVASAWNDGISSFRGYSNCGETLYEHGGFGGATYGIYTSSSYVGDAMNDRASSITFH
ncbi:hypothetical protein [Streptomyces sp. NPDC004284]|uniref:hypothetical protein n=1 Tax=Streptomyces sp. NPDC004284 TaxID=3364695 RepID=UPI0036A4BBE6